MSLYDQFQTNVAKENEGVEVKYGANADGTIPTFVITRMGKTNKKYQKALEAATRPYRRQIDLGTMKEDQAEAMFREVFVDTILKGWSNVLDRDGKPLKFSRENALKLLTDLPELYDDLQDKARSAALFREEALEDEAKN